MIKFLEKLFGQPKHTAKEARQRKLIKKLKRRIYYLEVQKPKPEPVNLKKASWTLERRKLQSEIKKEYWRKKKGVAQ